MRSVLLAGAVLALVSSPLVAQSPDSSGHWELGLYPTARKLTYDLAARHEWGGGGTVGIGYRFSRVVSLNAELEGSWIPQLNTVSQGQVNELPPRWRCSSRFPATTSVHTSCSAADTRAFTSRRRWYRALTI